MYILVYSTILEMGTPNWQWLNGVSGPCDPWNAAHKNRIRGLLNCRLTARDTVYGVNEPQVGVDSQPARDCDCDCGGVTVTVIVIAIAIALREPMINRSATLSQVGASVRPVGCTSKI